MIHFYGYKNCSTCRNAEKLLIQKKLPYTYIDITTNPPSAKQLTRYVKDSGLEIKKFLNSSGEAYRELGLKDSLASMSEAEIIALLASHGRLIKRPLIVDDKHVTVGFKDEAIKVWSALKA